MSKKYKRLIITQQLEVPIIVLLISAVTLLITISCYARPNIVRTDRLGIFNIDTAKASFYSKRSWKYVDSDKLTEALRDIDSAIYLNPDDPEFFFQKSRILGAMKKPSEGIYAVNRAIELYKATNSTYTYFKSRLCYDSERYDDAYNEFKTAISLGEKDHFDLGKKIALKLYSKADQSSEEKNYSQAIKDYLKAAELFEDNFVIIYSQIARMYYYIEDYNAAFEYSEKSISHIKKMQAKYPKIQGVNDHIADVYLIKAAVYAEREQFIEAKNILLLGKKLTSSKGTISLFDKLLASVNAQIAKKTAIATQIPNNLKLFQGTFVSTPYGDLWTKIKISGSKVTFWGAMPNSGSWGQPKVCSVKEIDGEFQVIEQRSMSDGSKYFYTYTSDCNITYYIKYYPTRTQKYYLQYESGSSFPLRRVLDNYNPWN